MLNIASQRVCLGLALCPALIGCVTQATAIESTGGSGPDYLGDHPELLLTSSQAWGELGWNTAAHAPGRNGEPLRIAGKPYARGLGHHATGSIVLAVDGVCSAFDAEVGLQPCGDGGSVVFRVYADGDLRFDSGILRSTNEARQVHVDLAGIQELRLEVTDAGDGITCDVANWADARLTRAAPGALAKVEKSPDMAPFGRVVTWDPNRNDGCRANRLEEFRAEDVYLETDAVAGSGGTWLPRVSTNGLGCIGLRWLNRRSLKTLCLQFPTTASAPPTNQVRVEGWSGESAWQGAWKPLAGDLRVSGSNSCFHFDIRGGMVQVQKVRWIFPVHGKPEALRLEAGTRSRWSVTNLVVEAEKQAKGTRGEIMIENGEFSGEAGSRFTKRVKFGQPVHFAVRYSRPSWTKADSTMLRLRLRNSAFTIAVEDVLNQGCVYLPEPGVLVSCGSARLTLAEYKRSIAGRKTVLQQVRDLPDQTLAHAMANTHHQAQNDGPVLLSLACDNAKFVMERDGNVRFQALTNVAGDWIQSTRQVRVRLGTGELGNFSRALIGGWLPIPVIAVQNRGVAYQERVFVAPADEAGTVPGRLGRPPVCVIEIVATNTLNSPALGSVEFQLPDEAVPDAAEASAGRPKASFVIGQGKLRAWIRPDAGGPLKCELKGKTAVVAGDLSARGSARVVLYLAYPSVNPATLPDAERLQAATVAYWNAVLAPAAQVETPEPLLNDALRSSQVRCLIDARSEADFSRVAPWIAAVAYGPLESEAHSVIRGMAFLGHEDFARRGLDFFVHRYNTNGFLTTGYTTFGTAWHLWTLGEQVRLYRDTGWLRSHAQDLGRAGDWIVAQTRKTRHPTAPESGLMPPGVLADWNAFAFHFALSGYYYAALSELGAAFQQIDQSRARFYARSAEDLRQNILRVYRWTRERSPAVSLQNGTWVPYYPSQVHSPGKLGDFFPGQDAGRSWCYDVELGAHQLVPVGVLSPRSAEVEPMLDHMEDVQFLADGWFDYPATMNRSDWYNLGGFSKVQPYYTRNCEIYAMRDDVKPFVRSYFNTLAAMLNPEVMTFWEHFNHSGAWDKTHETGYFLHQTRTMLLTERGDELWLAPMVTSRWFADGRTLSVSNAPTRFGAASYRIESRLAQGCIHATVVPPVRNPPKLVVLRLRHPGDRPIQAVSVNGRRHAGFDPALGLVRLKPDGRAMHISVLYGTP